MTGLVLAVVLLQVQVSQPLEVTLTALEQGVAVNVSPEVAAEAVGALRSEQVSPERLELLLRVAIQGGAHEALAPAVGALVAADGERLMAGLRAADALGRRHGSAIVEGLGPAATRAQLAGRPSLLYACDEADERAARGAIIVVMAGASDDEVRHLLGHLLGDPEQRPRATLALELVARRRATPELFATLLELAGDPSLAQGAEPLGAALAALVDQRPKLSTELLDAVQRGPTPALLGGLVAAPPESWDRCLAEVQAVVETYYDLDPAGATTDQVQLIVAALRAGRELRADALLAHLPALCAPTAPMPIRMVALGVLAELGARDARVVDLLLGYLDERDPIGKVAYDGLCRRTGAKLPPRSILWKDWRARTKLPEMTPEQHAERLARERVSRYEQRSPAPPR